LRDWQHVGFVKTYKPAFIYVNPADLAAVTAAVGESGLTLPVLGDPRLEPGKVRICTDTQVTEDI